MANGEPIEKTVDRVEEHVLRIERKIDKVIEEGCPVSRRNGAWIRAGIIGIISTLGFAAAWLLTHKPIFTVISP